MAESENNIDNIDVNRDVKSFFEEAEVTLNVKIPEALKNVLVVSGFENLSILATLNEENVQEIEMFVRNDLHQLIDPNEYPKYYGIYSSKPELFKIAIGHKNVLFRIKDYCLKKQNLEQTSKCGAKRLCDSLEQNREMHKKVRKTGSSTSLQTKNHSAFSNASESLSDMEDHEFIEDSAGYALKIKNKIFEIFKQWAKSKVSVENWNNFRTSIEQISLSLIADGEKCVITCFCGINYTISKFQKKKSSCERWIYSNFQQHLLKKHISELGIESQNSSTFSDPVLGKNKSQKNKLITSYLLKSPKINLIQDIHIPKNSLSQNLKQTDDQMPEQTLFLKFKNTSSNVSKKNLSQGGERVLPDNGELKSQKLHIPLKRSTSHQSFQVMSCLESCKRVNEQEDFENENTLHEATSSTSILSNNTVEQETSEIVAADVPSECSGSAWKKPIISAATTKWKQQKYQRCERLRRSRERIDLRQTLITTYFKLADEVCDVITNSPNLLNLFSKTTLPNNNDSNSNINVSTFLKTLLEIAQKNLQGPQNKNFYDVATKKFAIYIFYVGGRLMYETLHANLPRSLPSISTLNRFLTTHRKPAEEGDMDFEGLAEYLEKRKLPKIVWIAEDATRITSKIEYSANSNKAVGFVLPLKDGVPLKETYIATSAKKIRSFFESGVKSNYAYVITAQPLSFDAPSYCLSVFGTDNKFTADDVLKRWDYFKQTAKKFGIIIMGFSSDGDSRLLKAMRINTVLPTENTQIVDTCRWEWYHADISNVEECHFQDTVHIITKLRTRILKPGIVFPLGNFCATAKHLYMLIEGIAKDKHLLTKSDLQAEDKMNFASAEKMCSTLIIDLLNENSEFKGTTAYLKIMRYIIIAFLDPYITISSRLYNIWYCVFFLRIWRAHVLRSKNQTLKNNFLTSNCYLCIELNAHNLIKLILMFRDAWHPELKPEMFCLPVFSSQACEKLFRSARSITSTFSTIINFSMKEFLHRIDRIKMINSILSDLSGIYVFPREEKTWAKKDKVLPSSEDFVHLNIEEVVLKSLADAVSATTELGIEHTDDDWKNMTGPWHLDSKNKHDKSKDKSEQMRNDEEIDGNTIYTGETCSEINMMLLDNENDGISNETSKVNTVRRSFGLKDYSKVIQNITEDSNFVEVEIDNKKVVIKKSSYIWLLDESAGKISNDRMRRFILKKDKVNEKVIKKIKDKNGAKKTIHSKTYSSSSDLSSSESSSALSLHDSSSDKLEMLTDSEIENNASPIKPRTRYNKDESVIFLESYYAIFYDQNYYIGRVIEILNDKIKIKFLKRELNDFIWPRNDDIAFIDKNFIFYGPINMLGTSPLQLKQNDLIDIEKKYKELKKKREKI